MAAAAADQAGLADSWMVLKAMAVYSAAQAGDTVTCATGAAEMEAFALAEGSTAVCAEAAFLWACAGRLDRARVLVHTFHGPVLDELPRDMNWLLTLQCVLEAALAVDDQEVVATAARLLTPYQGRAVINGGAVMFHGLTDDTLARAAAACGDAEAPVGSACGRWRHMNGSVPGGGTIDWRPGRSRPCRRRARPSSRTPAPDARRALAGRVDDGRPFPSRTCAACTI